MPASVSSLPRVSARYSFAMRSICDPVLQVPDAVGLFMSDDELVANLESGTLLRRGVPVATATLPNHIVKILRAGGILPLLRDDPEALA